MMEIIKSYCRQDLNNYFVEYASKTTVESLYGDKKIEMLEDVTAKMKEKYNPTGIIISDVSYKSEIRFPENVSAAINAKIAATQIALQKEQEIMQAEADAKKQAAAAEGQYQADLLHAKGNIALANSITANIIQYELAKKWNGVSPIYSGSGSVLPPFFSK
jgi:regulator of protease activity HflC (stomatin/prohibitin superfamily)